MQRCGMIVRSMHASVDLRIESQAVLFCNQHGWLHLIVCFVATSLCRWIPIMMAFGGMFMFTMFPLMALGIFPLGLMLKNLALLVGDWE